MTDSKTKNKPAKNEETADANSRFLILHNDDVHTLDYVIESLMDICGHNYEQASQCAIITHYKGKCDVKHGSFESLKTMKDALITKKLTATID
ncbi:MAG: ATP-dependent Clp protease adaptor ClpS [Prolixibacteraceae bacterium]|nr:ATP-dependent Clp protease adaptor ClpS [Prolixibacteraceae bacterium]